MSGPTPDAGEPDPAACRGWHPAGWAVVAFAFAVGFANFPLRALGTDFDHLPGDAVDNRLNNFILEHGYRYLSGREASFWDAPMFYPTPAVTRWSDAHIGMLPAYATMRAAGLSPERAFQGHCLLTFILNYAAAVWALRRLGFGPIGTAAGAYIFAFGLPVVARLTHTQLFARFLVPPAVVFGWEFLRSPRTWRLGALAACVVGQLSLTIYIGYFLVWLLLAGLAVVLLRFRESLPWDELWHPGPRTWRNRAGIILLAVLAVVALVMAHARGIGVMAVTDVRSLAPDPGSWLTPTAATALYPRLADLTGLPPATSAEQQLFMGAVPLAALLIGLLTIIRPGRFGGVRSAVAVAAASSLIVIVFFTHWAGVWPYELVARLPGVTGIRVVGRIVLVLLFPAAVAVAGVVGWIERGAGRWGRGPAVLAAVLALTAVAVDQWLTPTTGEHAKDWDILRYPLDPVLSRQQKLGDAIRAHPAPTLVYVFPSVPCDDRLGVQAQQLEALRAAQDLGVPCVNGWSGYFPVGWDVFRGYRDLMAWLTVTKPVPAARLAGLVVVGEPVPDADGAYEVTMRAAYSPRSAP